MDIVETRPMLQIAAVERETGLGKDTLRAWERRYGFPCPLRDANGERCYPAEQVERLRLLKRLIDTGLRPGKLVGADDAVLAAHVASLDASPKESSAGAEASAWGPILELLRLHRSEELRRALQQRLMRQGLPRFVIETVAPLNTAVGEAWMRGQIDVVEEHLYTEFVQNLLRNAISATDPGIQRPRVMLTTVSEEAHILGLLMAEALLVTEGAHCVSLGTQLPLADIAQAARGRFDVVALSYSAAFPTRQAHESLLTLRQSLPGEIALWAGGRGLGLRAPAIDGVRIIQQIGDLVAVLEEWRARQAG